MRRALRLCLSLLPLALLATYASWTQWQPQSHYLSDLRSSVTLNHGTPGSRGNLLGIQPELFSTDYQSSQHLYRKLAAHLEKARSEGLLNARSIVILPEHIGTWQVAAGEKPQVFAAETVDEAMLWLALNHPLDLLGALVASQGSDRLSDALFRMKAEQMANDYQSLFGGLAESFGVTLVAGSIVLPEPEVVDGILRTGPGPLYNVSLVFGADGAPLGQPQRKAFPIPDETGFTAAAPSAALQVIDTPAGRLGVLICADSWYPDSYQPLAKAQVELVAVPAFLTGNQHWQKPWGGYTTFAGTPKDAATAAGSISEGEAWQRHSLPARLASTPARAGLTVFMRGQLWNLGSDGRSMLALPDQHLLAPDQPGTQLVNLWL